MTDDERLRLAADATYLAGSIAAAVKALTLAKNDSELRRLHTQLAAMERRRQERQSGKEAT